MLFFSVQMHTKNKKNVYSIQANIILFTEIKKKMLLTCRTCLNCSSKLQPLFCCDEFDVSLADEEFDSGLP